ncbi:MAG: type II secretion system protein [Desulfuromonadales bacterium]|nr:type II secretion system protein [Desulfuromonadales bacterium]MDT8423484.1 type II secretion system protein [Desulfuromonadales bacterium]
MVKTFLQKIGRLRIVSQRGFTLIELAVVMTIVGTLTSLAIPSYQRSLIKARETVLMEDLFQLRTSIDAYFADNAKYPDSLDDLVAKRYLRQLPKDPFTDSADTWEEVPPEPMEDGTVVPGGVFDVHSGSDLMGLDGTPYREW